MTDFFKVVVHWQAAVITSGLLEMLWAFPLKWAWNYTATYLFGLPELNWLRAWLLLFILTILWKINIITIEK